MTMSQRFAQPALAIPAYPPLYRAVVDAKAVGYHLQAVSAVQQPQCLKATTLLVVCLLLVKLEERRFFVLLVHLESSSHGPRLAGLSCRASCSADVYGASFSSWYNTLRLTPKETQVLSLLKLGLSNKQIAQRLGNSETTVKSHVSSLLEKFGVKGRTELLGRSAAL
jgi:DNA-binding CsgD family transcriptional regulator